MPITIMHMGTGMGGMGQHSSHRPSTGFRTGGGLEEGFSVDGSIVGAGYGFASFASGTDGDGGGSSNDYPNPFDEPLPDHGSVQSAGQYLQSGQHQHYPLTQFDPVSVASSQ